MWLAVHEIFEDMSKLQVKALGVIANDPSQTHVELSQGLPSREMIPLRAEIRSKLNVLKTRLSEHLTERELHCVLFPIVVYFDEIVHSQISENYMLKWPSLQKELFQISNGGEVFYELIDDTLRKPDTISFIYEVFYFCLSDGFKGKAAEAPELISEYKRKLEAKISAPMVNLEEKNLDVPRIRPDELPVWTYVGTFAVLVMMYLLLYAWTVV